MRELSGGRAEGSPARARPDWGGGSGGGLGGRRGPAPRPRRVGLRLRRARGGSLRALRGDAARPRRPRLRPWPPTWALVPAAPPRLLLTGSVSAWAPPAPAPRRRPPELSSPPRRARARPRPSPPAAGCRAPAPPRDPPPAKVTAAPRPAACPQFLPGPVQTPAPTSAPGKHRVLPGDAMRG